MRYDRFMKRIAKKDQRDETGHLVRELHGVTLEKILEYLVARLGWPELASQIRINCFAKDPSIKSSLVFLRRTPWARSKVEELYVRTKSAELRKKPASDPEPETP